MINKSEPETRFAVLLFTDIVASTELKARYGVPAYSAALRVHNDHFERLARDCRGIRIRQNMGDGYFAEAGSVSEAVRFALLFQDAMRLGPWGEVRLTTRVGIHVGEVTALVAEGGSGILAPAADLAARVMSLAVGGQILLTRFPFDETRHFIREHPTVTGKDAPPLQWLAHGPYLLKGRDEPMEIFEVGAEGLAPLAPPPDGEKAKRAIRPGEEETLGWRPAVGLEIPGRPGWQLVERLGTGGFGEVWTGEHAKLRQRRAFKFCFDDERLRALKREVTLVRLLRTALGDRDDIVRFHELKLDEPPFYLESDLAPHGNLLQWAEKQGGLAVIPLAQRISLVAHTATALAAAHSIGVLHKDIKPTNILIFDAPDGSVRPRLVDFGIGTLADPAVLGQHGVTAAGFTRATTMLSTGTPTYSPPEYLAGKAYTVQGDIYGLGVLLYQLLTADSSRPIAPGWERDVTDPLLREDIAACVDGDPARRLASAADLADLLLNLDQRRAEIGEKERLTREAAARAEAETAAAAARLRASRLRKLAGAFATLALLAIAGGVWANRERTKALKAEDEARKVLSFFQDHVLSAVRPVGERGGLGHDATIRQALRVAEANIGRSFSNTPLVEASVRDVLGTSLLYLADYTNAYAQHSRALELYRQHAGPDAPRTLSAMNNLAQSLPKLNRPSEAVALLQEVLAVRRRTLGEDHPDTLLSMNNLAAAYDAMGDRQTALKLHQETWTRRKLRLGPTHPYTLSSMSSVGNSLRKVGRLEEAVPFLEEALRLHRSALATNHPYTITCMGHLASAYRDAKKLELALPLYREILALTRLERSPEHPYTAQAIRELAYACTDTGHPEEACALFTELLTTEQTAYGSKDARTLKTKTRLAEAQNSAGRYEDAVTNASEVLRLLLRVVQPEPATLGRAFEAFLVASLKSNHATEALPLLDELVPHFEGSSITTNKNLCAATQKLITIALDSGKLSSDQRARARTLLDRTTINHR